MSVWKLPVQLAVLWTLVNGVHVIGAEVHGEGWAGVRGQVALAELIAQALQSASPGSSVVTVQLRASSYVLRAGTTPLVVPSHTTLLITGQGSSATTLTWEAKLTTTLVSLQSGAQLVISHLTIDVDAAAAPTSLPAGLNQWPVPFIASAINATAGLTHSGAAIQLLDVVVQLAQCSHLASYQQHVCAHAAAGPPDGAVLWGMPQVQPGAVQFRAPAPDTRFTALSNVLLTCANSATGGASAAAQPSSIENSSTPSFSVPGWPTPACLIQPAANESQLQLLLSTVSNAAVLPPSSLLVVQLMTNISLDRSVWPVDGVLLSTTVVLTGMPNSVQGVGFRGLELDLDLVTRFVRLHQELGSLSIVDLCVTNMAYGPDSQFPMSMLVGAMWMVRFDRPSANRTMLLLQNSQLVVPPDLFSYLSYWAAIQTSPVPSVRAAADWLHTNVYFGQTVGGVNDHSLLFSTREGQGTLWITSLLTDTRFHAPLLMTKTGISDLVPGNPNAPLTEVMSVYNATQLVSALQAPTVPYLVLLYNMELNASTVQAALNTTSTRASVTTPVTLLGRPNRGAVILDLGGAASLLSLAMPQGSRLVLQRLVVTGLGPATSNSSRSSPQALLANVTSLLWAFDFSRKQPMLRLSNVTLVISPAELSVMQQALSPNLLSGSIAAIPADPAVLSIIQSNWTLSNAVAANQTALVLSDVASAGIDGTHVVLSSQLPRIQYSTSAAYSFNVTEPADVLLTPPAAAPPRGPTDSELATWGLAGIVIGCAIFIGGAVILAWCWWRRMQQLKQAVDVEKAAKTAALEQVEALATHTRLTPSETSLVSSVMARLAGAAGGVSALPPGVSSSLDSHGWRSLTITRTSKDLTLAASSTTRSPPEAAQAVGRRAIREREQSSPLTPEAEGLLLEGVPGTSLLSGQPGSMGGWRNSQQPQEPPVQVVRGSYDRGGTSATAQRLSKGSGNKEVTALPTADALQATDSPSVAAVPSDVEPRAGAGSPMGSSKTAGTKTGGSEIAAKAALVISGLAAGDEEAAPDDVLTQIINQRKAMQGIDLQQVEFQEVLGQGSFGVVYKGRWRSLTVAIKTLMFQDAGAAKRLRQRAITEAAINTLLTDDNIINTYAYDLRVVGGSGMPDDKLAAHWKLYIVQEYCDAGSLAQAVDAGLFISRGHRDMMCILQLALDIAKGMSYIHAANVIHGDLSSGNIMLRHERRPTCSFSAKVGDFGLSRFLEGPEHSHISNARQGTPFYIAPELMDKGIISKETDVFAFGVLLWEMFIGMPPWRDPDLAQFRHALNPRSFPYSVPLSCPYEYHSLIMACLSHRAKSRPRFSELVTRIGTLLEMLQNAHLRSNAQASQQARSAAPCVPPPPPPQAPPTAQFYADARQRGAAGIAAAVAAAAAAAAGMAAGTAAGVNQPSACATPPVDTPTPADTTNSPADNTVHARQEPLVAGGAASGGATDAPPLAPTTAPVDTPTPATGTSSTQESRRVVASTPPQAIPQLRSSNRPSGRAAVLQNTPPDESWEGGVVASTSSISEPLMIQSLENMSLGP